jgi:hypothetical protein
MSPSDNEEKVNYRQAKGLSAHVLEKEVPKEELDHAEGVISAEHDYTDKQYKRLRWKIDLIIMPW